MKKKLIGILAVAVAAALLFGGVYLLTKDDIAQKKEQSCELLFFCTGAPQLYF